MVSMIHSRALSQSKSPGKLYLIEVERTKVQEDRINHEDSVITRVQLI